MAPGLKLLKKKATNIKQNKKENKPKSPLQRASKRNRVENEAEEAEGAEKGNGVEEVSSSDTLSGPDLELEEDLNDEDVEDDAPEINLKSRGTVPDVRRIMNVPVLKQSQTNPTPKSLPAQQHYNMATASYSADEESQSDDVTMTMIATSMPIIH